ncbi:conserved protein of unknown function precursor containing a T9SS type A C-terminal secretion signal [Tenacibaculum sp. 190524A02b]|uniref:T9SS type A sorting domain-containing protein n=1 Tax=Tenacibaculum vairaonense TaxID=3137860 RepID=UPI0032B1181B
MKLRIIAFTVLLVVSFNTFSQNDIKIVFSEADLNNAMKAINDARGINFGEYRNKRGLNAWFVSLNNARFDIKPNNTININNLNLTGGVDLNLWVFAFKATGVITGTIGGEIKVSRDNANGFSLHVIPTVTKLGYSGPLQEVVKVIKLLAGDLKQYIPKIELNLGNSLLPNSLSKYFECGIPDIVSDEHKVSMVFKVLLEDVNLRNKKIASGDTNVTTASNSITLSKNFIVEQGANFSAFITPKCSSYLKPEKLTREESTVLIEGDTIVSTKKLMSLEEVDTIEAIETNVDIEEVDEEIKATGVYPNPFTNTLAVKSPTKNTFSIRVTDMQGKVVYEGDDLKGIEKLNLSHLKSGAYNVMFIINHKVESKKVIKK